MASSSGKQGSKNAAKSGSGAGSGSNSSGGGSGGAMNSMSGSGGAVSLTGGLNKKKKPFLGMPAPLGYVPGLGRG